MNSSPRTRVCDSFGGYAPAADGNGCAPGVLPVGPAPARDSEPGPAGGNGPAQGGGAAAGNGPAGGNGSAQGSSPAAIQVFCADSAGAARVVEADLPEGFDGRLSLRGGDALDVHEAGAVLARLGALVCWAQAQQAMVVARLEELFARDIATAGGRKIRGWRSA